MTQSITHTLKPRDNPLLRSLITSIPDIIFYKDCEGCYLGANPAFEAYAGIKEKDIIGRTDLDFLPHDVAEIYRLRDREVLDSNTPRRNEEWIDYPDGSRALLETLKTPIRGPEGVVLGIIGISRDITAAKEMEVRLHYRMRFQALLARLSRDLINPPVSIDSGIHKALRETGEFVGAGRVYVFQMRPGLEVMDNTYEWCAAGIEPQIEVLQDLSTHVFPWWMTLLANGETIRVPRVADMAEIARAEHDILQAQGILSILVIPLVHQGNLLGFIGFDAVRAEIQWDDDSVELLRFVGDIIVNAIEQKRTRQTLLEAKEEAERAKRTQVMFLANMSHEIRTPLNAILGYAQILRHEETVRGAPPTRALAVILRSGEQLLELIDSLISLSRVHADGLVLVQDPFDLHGTLAMLRDMFAPLAASRNLELSLEVAGSVPRLVNGDEAKIRQVILNLVSNALRFTQVGQVFIKAALLPASGDSATGYTLTVSVRDTGCGIDREEQALIFEEFKQAAAGRHQMSGAGLGLALSRHYARLMGGDLSVESTPGAGSLFTFRFKVQAAMGEPRVQLTDTHRIARLVGDTPPPRLLVVDDDEANRDMLMTLLELAGFDVRVANDGEDACSTARAWKPDAVLLDKRMPGQPCVETIRRLKDLPGETPPSVLLVTADVMQEPAEEMALYKADGFIAKPIQPDVLFSELQRLLKLTYTSRVEREPVAVIDPSVESSLVRWLPGDVRARMCNAIDQGDIAELRRHIDGCTSGFPLLARQLRYLADRFAYDRLLELLNERKENTHAST